MRPWNWFAPVSAWGGFPGSGGSLGVGRGRTRPFEDDAESQVLRGPVLGHSRPRHLEDRSPFRGRRGRVVRNWSLNVANEPPRTTCSPFPPFDAGGPCGSSCGAVEDGYAAQRSRHHSRTLPVRSKIPCSVRSFSFFPTSRVSKCPMRPMRINVRQGEVGHGAVSPHVAPLLAPRSRGVLPLGLGRQPSPARAGEPLGQLVGDAHGGIPPRIETGVLDLLHGLQPPLRDASRAGSSPRQSTPPSRHS